ncbi:MAG TPA: aminopeptidase P family protein [Nitrolancea sp.]|jgi:Xaa-Pro aminopeptidase|nr:aminopeptidase P family protein [Nitrolancea sp.]
MQSRISQLRAVLRSADLDAIVITHPANRRYLTGFEGDDTPPNESSGHVVIGMDRAVLVVSPLEAQRAREQAPEYEIFDRVRPLAKADATVLNEIGAKRVGFEDDAILYLDYVTLRDNLGTETELVPIGERVADIRVVKSSVEISIIERAIEITDQAFERVAAEIKEGDTEREVALRLDVAMREFGASGQSFPTIVASGPNSARPHHEPSDRQIVAGEPIVIDMGAMVDGYCADLTRTVWVGEPNETLRAIYPIVLRALEEAEAELTVGMSGREGDGISREVIAGTGYGEFFMHGLGHGVGVQIHERPNLSPRSDEQLQPGHLTTIEPGIYLPGRGGVRIEDVVVVVEDGIRVLTRASKRQLG